MRIEELKSAPTANSSHFLFSHLLFLSLSFGILRCCFDSAHSLSCTYAPPKKHAELVASILLTQRCVCFVLMSSAH
jgi:hypothetical protein